MLGVASERQQVPIPVEALGVSPESPVAPLSDGVSILSGPQQVLVRYVSDRIIHVQKWLSGETPARPSLVVPRPPSIRGGAHVEVDGNRVLLKSGALRTEVSLKTGCVVVLDPEGKVIVYEEEPSEIVPVSIPLEPAARSVSTRFVLDPNEAIYGLGQHQDGLMNYRGHTVTLVQANTQSSNPFLLSTKGYGILWDNYSKTIVADGKRGCSFWSEVGDCVDYYVIFGGSMDGAVAGYRELTGQAPLYGRWAYGYWQSKEHYEDREELLKVAAEYRRRQIPIDNIIQDWDYWDGRDHWNQLFFWDKLFPRPEEMIDILHRENFHFMVSIWSGFGPGTPVYQDMERRGFLYPTVGWAGFRYFDPYNPAACDLYWDYIRSGLFSKGVDGWWMDSTEPDIVNALTKGAEEYEMKRVGSNHLGSFSRYLNTYPLLATEAVYSRQRRDTDQKRVYILTRSAFAGQQRAAATTWSGDIGASWDIYRRQISAALNHSMSGIPYWTFDIGAFMLGSYGGVFVDGGKDPAYQELYTRMFQFGAFCPIFRSHGSETPREIWEFGPFTDVLIDFDRLRYRLMPYIYSTAWRVTSEGCSLMRGLPMDFPKDRTTHGIDDQFLFGPSLMVCPVTEYMLHRPPGSSVPVPPDRFRTPDGKPGLDAAYFDDDQFGHEVLRRAEADISLDWYTGWPSFIKDEKFSMRWEGKLIPSESGPHRFHVKSFGPRLLQIDGQDLKFAYRSVEAVTEQVQLEAGREYKLSFATSNAARGAFRAQLFWKTPSLLASDKIQEDRPRTRQVYLPAGTDWIDFWTGAVHQGGKRIASPAPIESIPLFVRAGSILPMGPFVQYASEKPHDPAEIRIYPGADAEFVLYEDENDTYHYEKGVYSTIRFTWHDATSTMVVGARKGDFPGMPKQRVFNLVLVRPGHGIGLGDQATPDAVVAFSGDMVTLRL
jgi:alpha-D-xyloside xylohydrolase